jgi:hypothetical protein
MQNEMEDHRDEFDNAADSQNNGQRPSRSKPVGHGLPAGDPML